MSLWKTSFLTFVLLALAGCAANASKLESGSGTGSACDPRPTLTESLERAQEQGGGVVVGRLVGETTDAGFTLSKNELGPDFYQAYALEFQRLLVDDDLGYDFPEEIEVRKFAYTYWSDGQGEVVEFPEGGEAPSTCLADGHQKDLPEGEETKPSVFFLGRPDDGDLYVLWRADLLESEIVSAEVTSGPDLSLTDLTQPQDDPESP